MNDNHDGDEKLKAFRQRAKEFQMSQSRENLAARLQRKNGAGISLRGIFLTALLFIVLLMLLDNLVFKPRRFHEEQDALRKRNQAAVQATGEPAVWLGALARRMPGVVEVPNSRFAMVDGLPEAAAKARDLQRDKSGLQRLPVEIENTAGMRFRLVPAAGKFQMGSPVTEKGRGGNEVLHEVELPYSFYMGKFEVTQEEWEKVRLRWDALRADPVRLEAARRLGKVANRLAEKGLTPNPSFYTARTPRTPVTEVTWYDAHDFTVALCALEGVKIGTYRLPLETEWEWSCRAGSPAAFCFGNDPARLKNYDECADNAYARPVAVGGRLPNAFGLYNMHGNVWEWCWDVFRRYPGDSRPDEWEGITRVLRGGHHHLPPLDCRSAERGRLGGESHGSMLGFRVMRTLQDSVAPEPAGSGVDAEIAIGITPPEVPLDPPPETEKSKP
jgi:formylglycine-generating enzyme required for sulfatase activity